MVFCSEINNSSFILVGSGYSSFEYVEEIRNPGSGFWVPFREPNEPGTLMSSSDVHISRLVLHQRLPPVHTY